MSSRALARRGRFIGLVAIGLVSCSGIAFGDDDSPKVEEKQLPFAMHSRMSELPRIRVGQRDADMSRHGSPGIAGGRRLRRRAGRGRRGNWRGRVPDGRLAAPSLPCHGPRTEGQDDPPQGRRRDLAPGASTATSASSKSRSRTRRASRWALGSRSGTTTATAFTRRWRGSPGETRTPSRSTPPSSPTT